MFPCESTAGFVTGCRLSAITSAMLTWCPLLLAPLVATVTGPEVAPSGTRATRNSSELITTPPCASPNSTLGCRNSAGRSPDPTIRTSPPGSAEGGITVSMCGLPFAFFLPSRSEIAICPLAQPFKMHGHLHQDQCVDSRANVVDHDAGAFRQPL